MEDEHVYAKDESRFDGGLFGLIGINIACFFLCLFTIGIGVPWAIVLKYKWKLSHTTYNGRTLKFDGTGGQIIGSYILWFFLSIITLGIYFIVMPIKIRQWKVKHTHFVDGKSVGESKFIGHAFGLFGISLLCALLVLITLTLALPAAIAIKQRWETENTIVDGYRLRFNGRGIGLFGSYLKWILLSFITLGIYALWIPIKFENWIVSNTELVNPLTEKYVEKYSDEWYEARYLDENSRAKHEKSVLLNGIAILIVSVGILSYDIVLLVSIIKMLIFNVDEFLLYLALVGYGATAVPYSMVSGIILLILGVFMAFKPSTKSKFRMVMQVIGFAIVFLQSSSFVLVMLYTLTIFFPASLAGSSSILFLVLIIAVDVICLSISIIAISLFAKNYYDITSGRPNSILSHRKLKNLTSIAQVLSIIMFIVSLISASFYPSAALVLNCLLNMFIILAINTRVTNGLPYYYKMTSQTGLLPPTPTMLKIDSVELTNGEKINRALETGYNNLLTGSQTDERSRIGLLAIEEAIKIGSITAYSQLGAYHEDREEYEEALECYLKGYERGSSYAAYFIAKMYEEGRGHDKDNAKAREWYQKAADLGNAESKRILSSSLRDYTPNE